MGKIGFDGYQRRLDVFDYRARRNDVPRDMDELMEVSRKVELLEAAYWIRFILPARITGSNRTYHVSTDIGAGVSDRR